MKNNHNLGNDDMISDAMNAGVNPGGLQSRTDIRVLICYILEKNPSPVPLDLVKEQLHFEGIANYFETAFAITELQESGNIVAAEEEGLHLYSITDSGRSVCSALEKGLPQSVKDNALKITQTIINRRRNERENKVVLEKNDFGYFVTCSVMEKDLELVSVKLLVPDKETAKNVKNNFLNNPIETLVNVTASLTGMKL